MVVFLHEVCDEKGRFEGLGAVETGIAQGFVPIGAEIGGGHGVYDAPDAFGNV